MNSFITQKPFYLIKKLSWMGILLLLATQLLSCNDGKQKDSPVSSTTRVESKQSTDIFNSVRFTKLSLPSGKVIETKLAITQQEQNTGLSGSQIEHFGLYQGLLFYYPFIGKRQFWMPDTYFNIDIIFLDKNLKVIAVEKNVPAHPGRQEPPRIYRTKTYLSRHVLEIRADSPLSKEINVGTQFAWISKTSLSETESQIHQLQ